MKNTSNVAIVTVNYNSSLDTEKMIQSLLNGNSLPSLLVIVDNSSNASELEILELVIEKYKSLLNIVLIKSQDNLGYFGGLNLGLSNINHNDYSGVIVCNNDLIFPSDFIININNKKVDDNVYAICPSVKTIDGIYQNPSMKNRPSIFRVIFYDLYYSNYYIGLIILKLWRALGLGADSRVKKDNKEQEIFIGIGAIYFLTKNYFKYNESLPNDTFLYGEEAFLSKQIKGTGGIQLYAPELEVIHSESISTSKLLGKQKYKFNKNAHRKIRSYFIKD